MVFISPDAMESRSVSHEIEYALTARHLSNGLIPVVLEPTKKAPWIPRTLHPIQCESPSKTSRQIIEPLNQTRDAAEQKPRAI
jgi:hypothetical protein